MTSSTAVTPTAGARRRRYALQTAVLVLAITCGCVFAGVISSARRARMQFDLTGSREHRLSDRTQAVIKSLDATYQVVVAANMRSLDPVAMNRTFDVLDSFARATLRVEVRRIDTGSSRGSEEFNTLLLDLAKRFKSDIESQVATITDACSAADARGAGLNKLSQEMLAIRDSIGSADKTSDTVRQAMDNTAAKCRVLAQQLGQATELTRATLKKRLEPTAVPPLDEAARSIGAALSQVSSELAGMQRDLDQIAQATAVAQPVRERARALTATVKGEREPADISVERISRLPAIPLVAVARTLEKTSAALVIGPPKQRTAKGATGTAAGVTAIDFDSLFPPRMPDGAPAAPALDLRSRAEELVSTAIASLGSTPAPIVVLVHDQPVRLGPKFERFAALADRLQLRGIDLTEWATALDAELPPLTKLNPAGDRPVVYALLPASANNPQAATRLQRIVNVQNKLVADGKPILMSVNLSTRPSIGDTDPLLECLVPLGLTADSGRPLMRQFQGPAGRLVTEDEFTTESAGRGTDSDHLIGRAIHGLRCHFPWVVAVRPLKPKDGAPSPTISPLVTIADDNNVWGESEWLPFAQTAKGDRQYLTNPPAEDSPRDDGAGPWTIAAAVELPRTASHPTQRAVVVGCSPWFIDEVTQAALGVVDGRPVLQSPGNLELFEASVYWLSGQDEMIARSATAEAVPMIPPLAASQALILRWLLIGGLPVLVLLIGAGWRLARG